ncbi:MAG: PDZ domain-containing protein [Candidatus Zixiibacteriota bacterium]|jgi:hypothetical protein
MRFLKIIPALSALALAVLFAGSVCSQTTSSPYVGDAGNLPAVTMNDHAVTLQRSLYPDFYSSHSSSRDLRWVAGNDSAITAFWDTYGDVTLNYLSELSGLLWKEKSFEIYLLRYFPSIGTSDPLMIPVGGIRNGGLTLAAPDGSRMTLNIVFQLARRMLEQAVQPQLGYYHPVASHPLWQAGPYRRDMLAMLLALVTTEKMIGLDSAYAAYQSAFWQQNFPAREVFEQYLLKDWILTPERPLVEWVLAEPRNSALVEASRPPRPPTGPSTGTQRRYIEGLPAEGRLGFSVTFASSNRLVIDKIDVERLAYANGLREGDIIRSVNGQRVRNQKDLIEKILATLDQGGATLQISREGENKTIVMQPMDLGGPADDLEYDEEYLYQDTLPPDTTAVDTSGGLGPDKP